MMPFVNATNKQHHNQASVRTNLIDLSRVFRGAAAELARNKSAHRAVAEPSICQPVDTDIYTSSQESRKDGYNQSKSVNHMNTRVRERERERERDVKPL